MRAVPSFVSPFVAALLVVCTLAVVISSVAGAGSPTYVRGYIKSNGT